MTRVSVSVCGAKKPPEPPVDRSKLCGLCGRPEPPHKEITPIGTQYWDLPAYQAIAYRCACGTTRLIPRDEAPPALVSLARQADRETSRWGGKP